MTNVFYAAAFANEWVLRNSEQAHKLRDRAEKFDPTSALHEKFGLRKAVPTTEELEGTEGVGSDAEMSFKRLSKQFTEISQNRMESLISR